MTKAERVGRLSERQRALLERRLRGVTPAGIPRRGGDGPAPLLAAQEQLWIIDQLTPGSTAYSLPVLLRLRGRLDRAALARSLDDLVRRHEALRTRFPVRDGAPVQVVDPPRPAELTCVEAPSEARARELMAEVVREPFDLAAGPLHRAVLQRLGDRDHALLLLMHHMVADAWSQRVLAEDLAALYERRQLPELSAGPGDVAAWLRARSEGPAMREHLAYWRDRLRGELPPLELPSYRPRPAMASARGGVVERRLPDDLVEAVRALSLRHRVTPFMTQLAAFALLLGRYTGETDVVIGTTVAQRARPELERMVANLVNTLPLRIDLAGDPTFAELLDRVRETVLDGMAHAEAPYSRIVEVVRPARSASHNPLFQVLFVLQDVSLEPLRAGELVVDVETLDVETTQFDFALTVSGGHCHLQYNADLTDGETVTRLGAHYETLLRGVVADAGTRASRLPLLEAAERRRLLVEWNDTDGAYPADRCVHELFEARAAEAPDAVAVIMGDQRLTYGELNARANRLAHHLRGLGVGPDVLVGICVERSLDMVVAIYGVLKAGGGYVPTEPAHPPQRVDALLAAAGVRLVLTHARHRAVAAGPGGRAVLCLDAQWDAGRPDTDPAPLARPDNLLYVMFTSGSTGAPKGVMTTHRNLVDVMAFLRRAYGLTRDDRVLQHLPYSFDMSDGELFFPLLSGASTVLLPPGGHWDPARILGAVREHAVTSVQFVPSVFPALLEGGGWDECTSLRHVLSGGDALLADVNNELLRRTRGIVHNFYGPTETTMGMTYWRCEPLESHRIAPIGKPIENTRTYVLDGALEPVPAGVTGEVCIAGVTLARGYLNAPGLTAERFVPDPHSPVPGERMYRSGDLARWLPDGNLEFVGRADHQVKLRGFRIEPDEVRVTLEGHPDVGQAVVMVRDDGVGGRALVAYAAGRDGSRPVAGELRAFLRERLPEHMVPSAFVVLDALPRTPAGKVDRRALPAPVAAADAGGPAEAPRSALERDVMAAWREVLEVPAVGLHDNFFDLGGHSLLMVRLRQRLVERLGRPVELLDLFTHPTVAALAEHLAGPAPGAELEGARRGRELAAAQRDAVRRLARSRGGRAQ